MTTVDAVLLWVRATLGRFAEVVRQMTASERVLSAVLGFCILTSVVAALRTGDLDAWVIASATVLVSWLVAPVFADAIVARQDVRHLNAELITVHAIKPSGAPRVAEVPCRHGDMHRYLYGPDGWTSAGPAPDTRPEPQEART